MTLAFGAFPGKDRRPAIRIQFSLPERAKISKSNFGSWNHLNSTPECSVNTVGRLVAEWPGNAAAGQILRGRSRYTQPVSKRLQVLLPDREMSDIQRLARRESLTVGEWVRRVLREARATRSVIEPESKLKAVRRAAQYSFPTADIEQMLSEIERGYRD